MTFDVLDDGEPNRLDLDDRHVTYSRHGSAKTAVVLIHGGLCDRSHWHRQVISLSRSWSVITIDLAGHGESDPKSPANGVAGMGSDVAAVVSEAGIERAVLVGHSLGSLVALSAAPTLGPVVAGIVIVDFLHAGRMPPAPPPPPPEPDGLRAAMRQGMFRPSADPAMQERVLDAMLGKDPAVMRAIQLSAAGFDAGAALERVASVPLTMVFGGIRPVDGDAIRTRHPAARLFTLDQAGHFVMLDEPEAFNDLLATEARLMTGAIRQA